MVGVMVETRCLMLTDKVVKVDSGRENHLSVKVQNVLKGKMDPITLLKFQDAVQVGKEIINTVVQDKADLVFEQRRTNMVSFLGKGMNCESIVELPEKVESEGRKLILRFVRRLERIYYHLSSRS